jgi:hypothetical protein
VQIASSIVFPNKHQMKKLLIPFLLMAFSMTHSQGPPITIDKPIMLGAGKGTARALLRMVQTAELDFQAMVLEGDYNLSNSLAVGADVPVMLGSNFLQKPFGDVSAMLKYQFVRIDGQGKSLRIAAKAKQGFATGRKLETPLIGMGHHMTYGGVLAAYESLKLGLQSEMGYSVMYGGAHLNNLNYKFGIGLPLLKPTYPVNQVTVYLETEGQNFKQHHGKSQYGYFVAPGLQYARKRFTFDLSVQVPLAQQLQPSLFRKWSGLVGARVIL